jgi:hypothetical protein
MRLVHHAGRRVFKAQKAAESRARFRDCADEQCLGQIDCTLKFWIYKYVGDFLEVSLGPQKEKKARL